MSHFEFTFPAAQNWLFPHCSESVVCLEAKQEKMPLKETLKVHRSFSCEIKLLTLHVTVMGSHQTGSHTTIYYRTRPTLFIIERATTFM